MKDKEVKELWEAYKQIHQVDKTVTSIEEGYKSPNKQKIERQSNRAYETERRAMGRGDDDEAMRQIRRRNAMNNPAGRRNELEAKNKPTVQKAHFEPEIDLFDYLLEYLVAEGYADTNKAALAIMANMSEEWKQSIVEMSPAMQNLMSKPSNRIDGKKSPAPVIGEPPTSGAAGKLLKKPDITIR
jgi:hypothetical protein